MAVFIRLTCDPGQAFFALAEGGVGLIVAGCVLDKKEEFGRVADAVHTGGGGIAPDRLAGLETIEETVLFLANCLRVQEN